MKRDADDGAPPPAWHAIAAAAALERLGSDADAGLAAEDAARRLAENGPNTVAEAAAPSPWLRFAQQFKSPLIYILFAAAAVAAVLGRWSDAGVILGVVLANALIGAVQEGRAERSMAALRKFTELRARVLRDGREVQLAARELVPGDVLLLAAAASGVLWVEEARKAARRWRSRATEGFAPDQ
jgi:magnesium-transporting ATPase (P-type)